MPDAASPSLVSVSPILIILLSSILGVLVLLLGLVIGLLRRLGRIERSLRHRDGDAVNGEVAGFSGAEVSTGGAFETFLSEDPARKLLTKGEQFAAYRRWRQEKGLNWSKS